MSFVLGSLFLVVLFDKALSTKIKVQIGINPKDEGLALRRNL